MRLLFMPQQLKVRPEFGVQLGCGIAHDRQAAAFERAIFGECGHNHVTAGLNRPESCGNIGIALGLCRQKVKNCAVVPDIEAM